MTFNPGVMLQDLKFATRSLMRAKGLSITVVLTLALGIGANAAIFTLVRGVLLKPLVNRGEDRLIYIRQSALGIGSENTTFSVPEIADLKARVKSVSEFGDFSTMGFTMIGLGEPRVVRGGVVSGSYFKVVGLRPVLGRLLDEHDDGPNASGAVVLTYRFWTTALKSDPTVIGKTIRLDSIGTRSATIVGVLEPSVPYPTQTEIIGNIVTSPHHLSATMVTGRVHRMTELFGRLAPDATLDQARAELTTVHEAIMKEHSKDYPSKANFGIEARMLREQITSKARTVLLVLLISSALVFVIACSNVANLILARTVRREGELAIRAALGASNRALRWTLLSESLLLCVAGATLGVLSARPMVAVLARYASKFSVRALDLTIDSSMLWVSAGLALISAVVLAFLPRLPLANTSQGVGLATGGLRITGNTTKRLRAFAITQIAASFILLAGASMLLKTLLSLEKAQSGFDTHNVLAINVPAVSYGKKPEQVIDFYQETMRRIQQLPGVDNAAFGLIVPWRDAGSFGPGFQFAGEGHVQSPGEEEPRAQLRTISPGFFATLRVPIIAGRDFNDLDRKGTDDVVIVSQTLAQRIFPNQDPINRHIMWTDPVMQFIGITPTPRRIVGVAADIDDEHIVPEPTVTVYSPFQQGLIMGGRVFIHTHTDPYALVTPVTRIIRGLSADEPVEHAATLDDVRAEVLTPDRLNTFVFGGFAAVALTIAIVGVAGVLAFSVSGRIREFGIRLALGSQPRDLLMGVITEGAIIAAVGVVAGAILGGALTRVAGTYLFELKRPSPLPLLASAFVLLAAAVVASLLPAARAARVDVMQALRTE